MVHFLKNLLRPIKQGLFSLLNIGDSPQHILSIPLASLEDLIPNHRPSYSLYNVRESYGDPTLVEIATIAKITAALEPKIIFEFGTFEGGTTSHLAINSSDKSKIITLDLGSDDTKKIWDTTLDVYPSEVGFRFKNAPFEKKITQLLGDSQIFDFSIYHKKVDLVFVDACHHYEHVKKDSENAFKMLRRGGIILWHDYASYASGVKKALHEIAKERHLQQIMGTSLVIYKDNS